jgi:hypothetical protein
MRIIPTLIRSLAAAHLLILAVSAHADQEADIMRAVGEVAGELQVCSVYFKVISSCVAQQEPALSRSFGTAADQMGELAISTSRSAGVSDAAYSAMNMLHAKEMMKSMSGNCTNVAVLLAKYSDFCKRLRFEGADPRLKEWIACVKAGQKKCGGPLD